MGHGDPPIRHHNHQIPQAQFEARVPTHAQNDDLSIEVPSFEHIFDRDEPWHLFIIAGLSRVCTRAKTMICRSKCRPLNRSSIGTNRCISSSSPATLAFAPEPHGSSPLDARVFRPAMAMFTGNDAVLPFPLRSALDRADAQLDILIYQAFPLPKAV
jgi:hypothetical protein